MKETIPFGQGCGGASASTRKLNEPLFPDRATQTFLELSGPFGVTAAYAAESTALS